MRRWAAYPQQKLWRNLSSKPCSLREKQRARMAHREQFTEPSRQVTAPRMRYFTVCGGKRREGEEISDPEIARFLDLVIGNPEVLYFKRAPKPSGFRISKFRNRSISGSQISSLFARLTRTPVPSRSAPDLLRQTPAPQDDHSCRAPRSSPRKQTSLYRAMPRDPRLSQRSWRCRA